LISEAAAHYPRIEDDNFGLYPISEKEIKALSPEFSPDNDLNEFFKKDCISYQKSLLAKTYKFCFKERPDIILGMVSLLNDALYFEKKLQKKKNVPHPKRWLESYPAVKIGRLAINKDYLRHSLGSYMINLIKKFFLINNKTGCRFVTVDAYNKEPVLNFYKSNNFIPINKESDEGVEQNTISLFYNLENVKL
jgi:hypothetical protein